MPWPVLLMLAAMFIACVLYASICVWERYRGEPPADLWDALRELQANNTRDLWVDFLKWREEEYYRKRTEQAQRQHERMLREARENFKDLGAGI